jgi:DNA mismatch repair ATPase MutL
VNRNSQPAAPSHSTQPQQPRQQTQPRTNSQPRQQTQPRTQPQPKAQPQPQPQQPKAQPQQPQQPKTRPQDQPSRQPSRSGSNVRRQEPAPAPQNRQSPNQPGGSINRNQPQPGMSVKPDAPRTVRDRPGTPRNFEGGREPHHIQMHPGPGHNMERIPPRHRDPMPFGRAVRFWDGGRHYFGYRVSYLPSRYTRVDYWGVPYYLVDGIYYRYYRGSYFVSRPPFGVIFDAVLDNILYSVCNFAYYYDVYNTYRTINDNARTIASQNETIAANNATIARQNADIALNSDRAAKSYKEADRLGLVQSYADAGEEYFYQDGVFFIKDKNGKYVTIVPPAGALVRELPDDYDTITLDGEEYYKVDDTVYKLSIIDGSPYFEVLGQLTGPLAQKYDLYDTL